MALRAIQYFFSRPFIVLMKYLLLGLLCLAQTGYAQLSNKYYSQCFTVADMPKYKDSVALFTALIAQRPYAAALYGYRGYYQTGLKNLRAAIDDYTQALQLDANYLAAAQSLGLNYFFLKSYDTAQIYFKKALAINANDSDAKYMLGYTLYELKQYEAAAQCFATCHHAGVFANNAIEMTGVCWMQAENYQATLTFFDSLLQAEPANTNYLCYKARALTGLKKYGNALACFEKCLQANSKYADAYYYRAETFLALDNKRAAGKDYYQCALLGDTYARDILQVDYKPLYRKLANR